MHVLGSDYLSIDESDQQLSFRKNDLSSLITQVLREHPMLSYFQGFHDIVQVFLLVLGPDQAAEAVSHLSLLRIRDFMLPSLSPSMAHLHLLPTILYVADAKLYHHLSQTQPFFALAATITLYAHDIQEYGQIARLFDFLIAQPTVMSIYLFVVIILSRHAELFEIPADEPEMLHSILSKLPKPLELEDLISKAVSLFDTHPPETLPFRAWRRISYCSVLKTTLERRIDQSLQDGERFFDLQVIELRRQELLTHLMTRLIKYKRPLSGVLVAVAVGLIASWLGTKGRHIVPLFITRRLLERLRSILSYIAHYK